MDGSLNVVLSNRIYVNTENLEPRIQNQIRRLAVISNPAFLRTVLLDYLHIFSRGFIYLGEDDNGYICIQRGLLDKLKEKMG